MSPAATSSRAVPGPGAARDVLNIVVPMAGRGSRFAQAGFLKPKPLILLGGLPMIQWVIRNIRPSRPHRFIFVCLREHLIANPEVAATLRELCPGCEIIEINEVTQGAACTVLLARAHIDNDAPLMIANADQYVTLPIDEYLAAMDDASVSGLIMTFWADHPKWSYCRLTPAGDVTEVVEKKVISNEATVGLYNFRHGRDFVQAADEMIRRNLRVNNEFYVAPAYNLLIERGDRIVVRQTGREYAGMYGLGTPEDYEFFQTTSHFRAGCAPGYSSPWFGQRARLEKLTQFCLRAVESNNRAGLEALLHPAVVVSLPGEQWEGEAAVRPWLVRRLPTLAGAGIAPRNFLVDGDVTVTEFTFRSGGRHLEAVALVTWDGEDRIRHVRGWVREQAPGSPEESRSVAQQLSLP